MEKWRKFKYSIQQIQNLIERSYSDRDFSNNDSEVPEFWQASHGPWEPGRDNFEQQNSACHTYFIREFYFIHLSSRKDFVWEKDPIANINFGKQLSSVVMPPSNNHWVMLSSERLAPVLVMPGNLCFSCCVFYPTNSSATWTWLCYTSQGLCSDFLREVGIC
jgi:hypothetical protein